MTAAHAANKLPRLSAKTLGLGLLLALLGAFVIYAGVREARKTAPATAPQAAAHAFAEQRPAHSATEERFAQALWNIHAEVRTAAVRMTFAGLTYKMGDADRASIGTKVAPLSQTFTQAHSQLLALEAPASMQETRRRYADAVQLYAAASQEMVKVAQDGKDVHLLKAHEMSEQASGILLEVGEQLWPGEIKPN